jgi:hypothetical protein
LVTELGSVHTAGCVKVCGTEDWLGRGRGCPSAPLLLQEGCSARAGPRQWPAVSQGEVPDAGKSPGEGSGTVCVSLDIRTGQGPAK